MAKRIVLFDRYTWTVRDPSARRGWRVRRAYRGEEIDVSDAEAARGEALGALGTQADLDTVVAAEAAKVADTWQPADDDTVEQMNVAQVHAYLNAVPEEHHAEEVERIIELEQLRDKPRTGVLSLAE